MSAEKVEGEWKGNLTLSLCKTPTGFASLAAAVLSQLERHGKSFIYLDDHQNILHKDPHTEVAVAQGPVLVVPPTAVVDHNEDEDTMTVLLEHVQLLRHSGLILEEDEASEDS